MQSHSFQAKKFKLHSNVDDSSGRGGVHDSLVLPEGSEIKELITQKRYFVQSHSFQVKKFKLHRNVDDSSGQDSTVPPEGSEIKG